MNLKYPIYFSTGLTEKVWKLLYYLCAVYSWLQLPLCVSRPTTITSFSSRGPTRRSEALLSRGTCSSSNTSRSVVTVHTSPPHTLTSSHSHLTPSPPHTSLVLLCSRTPYTSTTPLLELISYFSPFLLLIPPSLPSALFPPPPVTVL